tara:strand:+ start:152 stop:469 length:318 start_codon:yes stop_codon:yes gene_type:complete
MPSEIAQKIVNQIYNDEKASAIDSINDALGSASYDAIQARKIEFAKSMGFDLDDTGQEDADEVSDSLPDGTEGAEDVEVDGRMPHEPPTNEQPEETTDEDNETDS